MDVAGDSEVESGDEAPESKRSRKWSGAATYRTKFNQSWVKEFPFISAVHKDPYRLGTRQTYYTSTI